MNDKGKVIFGADATEFLFPYDFSSFLSSIKRTFGLTEDKLCELCYFNNKGNITGIKNQQEYEVALKELKTNHSFKVYLTICNKEQVDENQKDDNQKDEIFECLACDGKKVNKKGNPCTKCKGTGKLNPKWQAKLEKMIEKKITAMFSEVIERQASQLVRSIQITDPEKVSQLLLQDHTRSQIHASTYIVDEVQTNTYEFVEHKVMQEENKILPKKRKSEAKTDDYEILNNLMNAIRCKACDTDISNTEYKKCFICLDYSVCNECAEDLLHDHTLNNGNSSFYPLNDKSNEPLNTLPKVDGNEKSEVPKEEIKKAPISLFDGTEEIESLFISPTTSSNDIKIRYVDKKTVNQCAPNEVFTKTWNFVNEGTIEWPNMEFVSYDNNILKAEWKQVPRTKPQSVCSISLNLTAPGVVGTYKQSFMFQFNGNQIGERVSVKVNVVDNMENINEERKAKARERLEKLKGEQCVPEMYEKNLLHLLEKSDEDPNWILSLLKDNNNDIELIQDLLLN